MNLNKMNRGLYKKCKRGKRKSVKCVEKDLIFGGINPDGALSKITTIKKAMRETKAAVWTMQETKVSQQGKLQFDGFITFEHIRTEKEGGGVALSALEELNPAFIRDGGDFAEAITVNIHLKKITISCNTGYGPQENASLEKKTSFWKYLDEECERAKKEGNGFILQGDLNAWLGPNIIPGDNKTQNVNGKFLVNFVKQNKLTIVNSLPMCKGTKTWSRTRQGIVLSSTIDFFIVCERVLPFIQNMVIHNDSKHIMTNYKGGKNTTKADHALMTMKVKLKVTNVKPEKVEMLNFKDTVGQIRFKESTSNNVELLNCFKGQSSSSDKINNWIHMLKKHCQVAFPTIRIRRKTLKPSPSDKLISERNALYKSTLEKDVKEVNILNVKIANLIANEQRLKCHMMKQFCDQNGSKKPQ